MSKTSTDAALDKGVGQHLVTLIDKKSKTMQKNDGPAQNDLLCVTLRCLASFALHETSSSRLLGEASSTMSCIVEIIKHCLFSGLETPEDQPTAVVLECATKVVRTFARHKSSRQQIASSGVLEHIKFVLLLNSEHGCCAASMDCTPHLLVQMGWDPP